MDKNIKVDKKSKLLMITSILALAIAITAVTFAYFSARITGLESASTLALGTGTMRIHYSEGNENVVVSNIFPRDEAWVTKTLTLTGTNTTSLDMVYYLGIIVNENTFPENYLTYDLTLVSSTNGYPIQTKTAIPINGTGTITIGSGTFTNASNDTHNYELKIYFKDNGTNQNDGQRAIFNAKIHVWENTDPAPVGWKRALSGTLLYRIKETEITAHSDDEDGMTIPGREIATTDEGLRATQDDYGISYYYRGAVENNYVIFANMCWRIVRIDGLGNIKLVMYNYNPNDVSNPCDVSQDANYRAYVKYNGEPGSNYNGSRFNKNTYIGFMYSTNPDSSSFDTAQANNSSSQVLIYLRNWYDEQLRTYNDMLADVIWCNDKSVVSDTTYNPHDYSNVTGSGVKAEPTYYQPTLRLYPYDSTNSEYNTANANPTLVCPNAGNNGKLSKFTARDTTYGNAKLYSNSQEYRIGLLTADEVAYAGAKKRMSSEDENYLYYLYKNTSPTNGSGYWTLSPYDFTGSYTGMWIVRPDGSLGGKDTNTRIYVRPAVSLKYDTTMVSSGTGTSADPFIISQSGS